MIKLVRRYVFYALVVALIYFIMPLFFQGENYKYDFIEYRFVFPATALVSGMAFSWKKGLDFTFPLLPPIIYIGSALIHNHLYHLHIYGFIYLILAMLGCFIGDMVYRSNYPEKAESRKEQYKIDHKIKISNISVDSINDYPDKDQQQQ